MPRSGRGAESYEVFIYVIENEEDISFIGKGLHAPAF
jgi:hypothetical protein